MKILIKILVALVVFGLAMDGHVLADNPTEIPIGVTIPLLGSGGLEVAVYNISNNQEVGISDISFDLSGLNPNDETKFWKAANQYIQIAYQVSWNAPWGLRLYTDNKTSYPDLWGKPIATGPNLQWDGPRELNPASDDVCTYGGLIYTADLTAVIFRAVLGWQVYDNLVTGGPSAPTDGDFNNGTPDDNTDDWDANWASIVDKGDYSDLRDFNRISWLNDEDKMVFNYNLIAHGFIGESLAQHPADRDDNGDGIPDARPTDRKIMVYLAGRFVSTEYLANPNDPDGTNFVLPAGHYNTVMYVELIHE